MHWLLVYLVWMVYIVMVMGIVEAAADRTQDLRGARIALVVGAVLGVVLSVGILWFGPADPFGPY